jgi:hypothetical protein
MSLLRILTTLLLIVLSGCTFIYDIAQWSEEALQPDGQILQVTRQAKRWGWGVPGMKPGEVIGYQLSVEGTDFQWWSEKGNINEPVSFEIIDGYPVLVLFDEGGKHCGGKSLDDYAVQILVLTNRGWIEISQAEAPLDRMHKNLFDSYWQRMGLRKRLPFMSLEYKKMTEKNTDYIPLTEWFSMPGRTCKQFL